MIRCILLLLLAAAALPVQAEEQLVVFSGNGSTTTAEFEVDGPWLLDWFVGGFESSVAGLEVTLVESELLRYVGYVVRTQQPGAGTKLFHNTGKFRFRVSSSFVDWRLRVTRITPEEAERMVPR